MLETNFQDLKKKNCVKILTSNLV